MSDTSTSPNPATSALPAKELNERNIKAAKTGDVLNDASVKGLHLRCFAASKGFYVYYRTKAGIQRRPKLGDFGAITLTQARKVAQEMLAEVASGRDPAQERADTKAEHTVNELWTEYWKRHGSLKKSGDNDKWYWEQRARAKIGHMKLSHVTYSIVSDLLAGLATTPVNANRVRSLLSKMFNFAIAPLEWTDRNPVKGTSRNKEKKRRRKASREEIQTLIDLLRRELAGQQQGAAAFLWLLMMTGARKGEIAAAKWSEIQGDRILLDEHKTDDGGYARIIYLPRAAREVLDMLPRTSGTITGLQSPQKLWDRLRKEAGCPDLTMHDLRRTFASVALSTGKLTLEQVMQMLGHTSAQTTKVYAWLMEDVATDAFAATAHAMEHGQKRAPTFEGAQHSTKETTGDVEIMP